MIYFLFLFVDQNGDGYPYGGSSYPGWLKHICI